VDSDPNTYTVVVLGGWKAEAEAKAEEEMLRGVGARPGRPSTGDFEQLRHWSSAGLDRLRSLVGLPLGGALVHLNREVDRTLVRRASSDSLLVVGDPGAGKTVALHHLAREAESAGARVLFLPVDAIRSESLRELRSELDLGADLTDVLEAWRGTGPAYLILDALDAARSPAKQHMLMELIEYAGTELPGWRAVASVRKFDLRYNLALRALFPTSPSADDSFQDGEFRDVAHLAIPLLDRPELDQLAERAPELARLIDSAPVTLERLLRVPFNLRIVGELLAGGTATDALATVRSQVELLDRYWTYRIIGTDGHGDAREAVVRRTCEAMVADRQMEIARSVVAADPAASEPLAELLSRQVLVEWVPPGAVRPDRQTLAFAHHVVFDFALAQIVLGGPASAAIGHIGADPDLVIFARPSLRMYFAGRFARSPASFWEDALAFVGQAGMSAVAQVASADVAVELVGETADLEQLHAIVEASAGLPVLRLLAQLATALGLALKSGVKPATAVWCSFVGRLAARVELVAYPLRTMLLVLIEDAAPDPDGLGELGQAARLLLAEAWRRLPRDPWLARAGLQACTATAASDPAATEVLLRRVIESSHLAQWGYEELHPVAGAVPTLVGALPDFVHDLYVSVMAYEERSVEATDMGSGRILRLRSSRRQDVEMAKYELGLQLPAFLTAAPVTAVRALDEVVEQFCGQSSLAACSAATTFNFVGRGASMKEDGSGYWDRGHAGIGDVVQLLDAFQDWLVRKGSEPDVDLAGLIGVLASRVGHAALWRRVLAAGTARPDVLGVAFKSLAWARDVLASGDTREPAGAFLAAVFSSLNEDERRRTEETILALAADDSAHARLLLDLDGPHLVTEAARGQVARLSAHGTSVSGDHRTGVGDGWMETPDRGMSAESSEIEALLQPVAALARQWMNDTPTEEAIASAYAVAAALNEALERGSTPEPLATEAENALGELCFRWAVSDALRRDTPAGELARTVLLRAASHPYPHPRAEDGSTTFPPSWGSPAPRVAATRGIMLLARKPTFRDAELLSAVDRLSHDRVPVIRYFVAEGLFRLAPGEEEGMWGMLDALGSDPEPLVASGVVHSLSQLCQSSAARVASLARQMLNRRGGADGETQEQAAGLLAWLWAVEEEPEARQAVDALLDQPATFEKALGRILFTLRDLLVIGQGEAPGRDKRIRLRVLNLYDRILDAAIAELKSVLEQRDAERDTSRVRWAGGLIDQVALNLYAASGAAGASADERPSLPQVRLWREARGMFDKLAAVPIPGVTHRVTETLERYLESDPREVFLVLRSAVLEGGASGGYELETMAVELIVRLVQRYIASHAGIFRADPDCREGLRRIFDAFVNAGWPAAQQLVYRLDDIYR
jgi:hypothetical protein